MTSANSATKYKCSYCGKYSGGYIFSHPMCIIYRFMDSLIYVYNNPTTAIIQFFTFLVVLKLVFGLCSCYFPITIAPLSVIKGLQSINNMIDRVSLNVAWDLGFLDESTTELKTAIDDLWSCSATHAESNCLFSNSTTLSTACAKRICT